MDILLGVLLGLLGGVGVVEVGLVTNMSAYGYNGGATQRRGDVTVH